MAEDAGGLVVVSRKGGESGGAGGGGGGTQLAGGNRGANGSGTAEGGGSDHDGVTSAERELGLTREEMRLYAQSCGFSSFVFTTVRGNMVGRTSLGGSCRLEHPTAVLRRVCRRVVAQRTASASEGGGGSGSDGGKDDATIGGVTSEVGRSAAGRAEEDDEAVMRLVGSGSGIGTEMGPVGNMPGSGGGSLYGGTGTGEHPGS